MRPLPTKVTYGDSITTAQSYHQPKWKMRTMNWIISRNHNASADRERNRIWTWPRQDQRNHKQIIISAADKVFGIPRLQNIRKCPAPWWNEECKIAMQESCHSFNRAKKILQTKTKRANFRILIERNMKQSWRNCISPVNPQIPTSSVKKKQMHKWLQIPQDIQFLETDDGMAVT